MPDHFHDKLSAYLDGELDQHGQLEIQAHLETCRACQDEIEERSQLSHLLRAAAQPDFTPTPKFKAQLMLQLPRQVEVQQSHPTGLMLLWIAPLLVLFGWIFFQVTLGLSSLVLIVNGAGFLGGAGSWITSDALQMQWFSIAQAALGGTLGVWGQAGLKVLNDIGIVAQNLAILLTWQVGAAVLYWGVLVAVWQKLGIPLWTSSSDGFSS
jgi:predicted anti-sigma-YlaC factor YlaD